MKIDICLANMPYAGIVWPSIALGILQSLLRDNGFGVESVYANLLFAEEIGRDAHRLVTETPAQDALGDWIFAPAAFPGHRTDDGEFIERFIRRNRHYLTCPPERFAEKLPLLREAAGAFVDRLARKLLERQLRVIGCTSTLQQHVSSLALLRRIHELDPDVITMMGGANCETVMGRTTHQSFPWVDYVVSGEAEEVIVPLVRAILQDGRSIDTEALPEGVFAPVHRSLGYPRLPGGGIDDVPRATVRSLNHQPVPDYGDYFRALEKSPLRDCVRVSLPVESSRGCWWRRHREQGCTFCGLNGRSKTFRSKAARQVIRELDMLHRRHGVKRFLLTDNTLDPAYFKNLFPELARDSRSFRLFYQLMAALDRRQIEALRRAGLTWVWCGIESLHSKVLCLMNKPCLSWQNLRFMKWCRQYGIFVGWQLMCDFPGEEDAWYREMAALVPSITHLQPPRSFVRLRFDRYSRYHERPGDYGLELRPAAMYPYIYPLADRDLSDLAYFFEDRERAENPGLSPLLMRPGFVALAHEIARWKKAFRTGNRPVLSFTVTDTGLLIRDTRPDGRADGLDLDGPVAELFLACEEAPRRRVLVSSVIESQGVSKLEAEAAVRFLLDHGLLAEIDGRLLTLAVREPCGDLPVKYDSPLGFLLPETEPPGCK